MSTEVILQRLGRGILPTLKEQAELGLPSNELARYLPGARVTGQTENRSYRFIMYEQGIQL